MRTPRRSRPRDRSRTGWIKATHPFLLISLVGIVLLASITIAPPTEAKVAGPNGPITFGRWVPAVGDMVVFTVEPDGTDLHQVIPGSPTGGECPHWSPDGRSIATCGNPEGGATRIIDPQTGSYRDLPMPAAGLFAGCAVWSPDAERLACEAFGTKEPRRNGMYTIRTSDGRGLRRVTFNPDGDDNPGDYSPDGDQIVFGRTDPNRPPGSNQALFVVNTDGSGLHRITPWSLGGACCGSWSPDGRSIVFAGGGKLYLVHPDGSHLGRIRLPTQGADYVASHPGWSPDGTMIVFSLFLADNGAIDVYIANKDGSGLTRLTTASPGAIDFEEGDEVPDWGPEVMASSEPA